MRGLVRVGLSIGLFLFSGCHGQQPPPFRPVADVKQMMNDIIEPSAQVVWNASGLIETADGVVDKTPTTEEGWTEVRHRAVVLSEAGNLLMLSPRAKDGEQWMTLARAMVDKGEEVMRAADSRSGQRMFDMGGALYETCLNCHQLYMPAILEARGERPR